MDGVDLATPPPVRVLPTVSDWTWVSNFPMSAVVGRRLPRLYRKLPFALRVEMQRAYSLPLRRLLVDGEDIGA